MAKKTDAKDLARSAQRAPKMGKMAEKWSQALSFKIGGKKVVRFSTAVAKLNA